jgi:O-antigen ligase
MDKLDIVNEYKRSKKILYILTTLYIAFVVLFAKPENYYIGNGLFLGMIAYFLLHEFIYAEKIYYINSEIFIYFLFMFYSALSIFWSIEPDFSIEITRRIFMIFASLVIIYNIIKKYDFLNVIFYGLLLATLVNFLIYTEVITVSYEIYYPQTDRFKGSTDNPNIISSIMFLSIFISAIYAYKENTTFKIVLSYLNIIIAYYIILATVSRTSLIVSLGPILIFVINTLMHKTRRKYFLISLFLVVILAVLFIDLDQFLQKVDFALMRIGYIFETLSGNKVEFSANERMEFIIIAFNTFLNNPFFGTGIDTAREYLGVYAHNNYAELLADTGLFGTTLYYLIYISLAYKIMQVKDKWIKAYLIVFILALLAQDIGGVSYYSKLTLTMIIVASYIAESDMKETKKS